MLEVENVIGSAHRDTIRGDVEANTLHGGGARDYLYGREGDDILYGDGGDDRLFGNEGNDTLIGGGSADYLYGQDGSDTLTGDGGGDFFVFLAGETGVDTITDFDASGGDKINIADVIDFTAGDVISEYVQITDDGTDSTLAVDADGAANGANFVTIATLQNVTGLTDEGALLTSGNLIAA